MLWLSKKTLVLLNLRCPDLVTKAGVEVILWLIAIGAIDVHTKYNKKVECRNIFLRNRQYSYREARCPRRSIPSSPKCSCSFSSIVVATIFDGIKVL
mmetsp:Transcript_4870/g.10080  ORF Transcript_4870/g.10080 Transcript_4870/m.10080 type:complete len:97 (+) Transcript_4870:926-1216(+)